MAEYRVAVVDLTAAQAAVEVVPRGVDVADVSVRAMPAGAAASLHFGGTSNDAVALLGAGDALEICPPESNGIYITNPAQPGVTISLLIGYASGSVRGSGS
jgi:hypothetical protein